MKLKIFALLASAYLLTSCASTPMPGHIYVQFADLSAGAQKCFESGLLSPKVYSDAKTSFSSALQSQNYDASQLQSMEKAAYFNFVVTAQSCRETEAAAHNLISEVEQRRANTQNTVNSFTPTPIPRTVTCTTYAGVTSCF